MTAWIGVAPADHVARGRQGGFMQLSHGKRAPLARIQPGDTIIYYSPTTQTGGGQKLQSFTAVGIVRPGEPYPFAMSESFTLNRRDVDWLETQTAPIVALLGELDLTRGKSNWGYVFRLGVVRISDHDRDIILTAMAPTASE